METIDLVANVSDLFKATTAVRNVTGTTCPVCLREANEVHEMIEVDRQGFEVPGPDRDCEPDYITTSIKYRCPECGEETTIHQ